MSISYLEVIHFTLCLVTIVQVCFLGRNGAKSLLVSHLHKIGWVDALPYGGCMEYLRNEVGWIEGSEGFNSEVRN